MPKRIQLKRTKGWRMPAGAVKVTRPGPFGNPFIVGGTKHVVVHGPFRHEGEIIGQHEEIIETDPLPSGAAVDAYKHWLTTTEAGRELAERARRELRGKDLACWCAPGKPCHADVLIEIANATKVVADGN